MRRMVGSRDNALFLELMALEARRNFLNSHAKQLNISITSSSSTTETETKEQKKERLTHEISALESDLRTHLATHSNDQDYLSGVLIPKAGTDADGISTRIANHFAQLSSAGSEKPFVILDKTGLQLYWNKPEDADIFHRFVSAHAVPAELQSGYLQHSDLPETMRSLPGDQCYQDQQKTRVVSIPHLYVEKFLALAQYHSYSLKPVASDWYAAKQLNRGELVTAEGVAKRDAFSQEGFEARFVGATRVHLNNNEDLVKVEITADVTKTAAQQLPHVVILFDDSGSMVADQKIASANAALKKFVMELSPDALVSIQPFCAGTVAIRKKASELQQEVRDLKSSGKNPAWCSIPASGGTPLVEILANSAVFLRESASDLAISDDAIRNSTVVLLTDGQANGAAKDAVFAMQTTSGLGSRLLGAVQVPGVTVENYLSYGLEGFSCRVLPVVFPISIGTDSDAVFMRELATTLHMPDAFVSTGSGMQGEIDSAMDTLHHMLVRVPQVFVGLGYKHNEERHAAGVEEHNVFNHRSRTIYLTVPRDASRLDLCIAIGSSTQVVSGGRERFEVAITDEAKAIAITNEYVTSRLMEIKMEYSKAAQSLSAGTCRVGRNVAYVDPSLSDETDQKFTALKAQAIAAARSLLSTTCANETKRDIELFISTVEEHASILSPVQNVAPTRGAIAQYTQGRMIGQAVVLPTYSIANTVFENIQKGEFSVATHRLTDDPFLVNRASTDQLAETPLISLIKILSTKKVDDHFMDFFFSQPTLDVTVQDLTGNTALHRAAWYGLFEECKTMLRIAKKRGQLDVLKRKTNTAALGATTGETFMDNIRRSDKLTDDQRKELLRICGESLSVDYRNASAPSELNSHFGPHWNTPIMQLLRDLRDRNKAEVIKLRQPILGLLDVSGVNLLESNFNGDTALHYAIWHGEFEIAEKIIEKTPVADRALLFAARNSVGLTPETGGEVPYMNLALSGKRAFVHFALDPTSETQAQLQKWLNLCETVGNYIDKKQLAELTHLMQVYEKGLQGYSTTTFLQAAPIVQFNQLITQCDSVKTQHASYTKTIDALLVELMNVKKAFSEKAVDEMIADLNEKIKSERQSLTPETFIASPVVLLYRRASETLTRLKDYVNAKSATVVSMTVAAQQNISATKIGMFAIPAAVTSALSVTELDALMIKVSNYVDSKKGNKTDSKYLGADALYKKLAEFKSGKIFAGGLVKYVAGELSNKSNEEGMFKATFSSTLKDHFKKALEVVNQIALRIGGDNFADRIDRLADGYQVHGRRNDNDHRFIVMYDDGSVVGYSGVTLGIVEKQLYDDRARIFTHFNVTLPISHSVPTIGAVVKR